MKENSFGRESRLWIKAAGGKEGTRLEDCFFRAPYKIMKPFYREEGKMMELMVMSASAGIMGGDRQQVEIQVGKGAKLAVTTQSYEKIHKMDPGDWAERHIAIWVEEGGFLQYQPLPVIPFAGSDFRSKVDIQLKGPGAGLVYSEVLSCGRAARGERFQYRRYVNQIQISCGKKLVYGDNTIYLPEHGDSLKDQEELEPMEMEEIGFFEGFTHLANLIILNCPMGQDWQDRVRERIEEEEINHIRGGVTRLGEMGYVVKLLGLQGEKLTLLLTELAKMAAAG